ncbi:hypothetical protein TorRG33x02_004460, partial [Trema orientale]
VTSSSARPVSSITRELRNECNAPSGYSINVATVMPRSSKELGDHLFRNLPRHLLHYLLHRSVGY